MESEEGGMRRHREPRKKENLYSFHRIHSGQKLSNSVQKTGTSSSQSTRAQAQSKRHQQHRKEKPLASPLPLLSTPVHPRSSPYAFHLQSLRNRQIRLYPHSSSASTLTSTSSKKPSKNPCTSSPIPTGARASQASISAKMRAALPTRRRICSCTSRRRATDDAC